MGLIDSTGEFGLSSGGLQSFGVNTLALRNWLWRYPELWAVCGEEAPSHHTQNVKTGRKSRPFYSDSIQRQGDQGGQA